MRLLPFIISFLLSARFSLSQKLVPNYDETKIPEFILPDPLTFNDGSKITTVEQWENQRRLELLELFSSKMYGRTPKDTIEVTYETLSENPIFLNGKATSKQVKFIFTNGSKKHEALLLLVLPNQSKGRAPIFVAYNFRGNHTTSPDTSIIFSSFLSLPPNFWQYNKSELERGSHSEFWPYDQIISRGYGIATMSYMDIFPDVPFGEERSICALFSDYDLAVKKPDYWQAMGAWAWGSSRIIDYLETQKLVEPGKIIIMGHSRQGKAALWAGAQDKRFSIVISNNSGCGGAALSKRYFGEHVACITGRLPWFCKAFEQYAYNEANLPFDQHQLIALMAPRKVYIASAVEDLWADPKGEFLSGYYAGPVYELYGLKTLGIKVQPPLNQPVMNDVGYHIREGKHDVTNYDWMCFMDFADKHLGETK